MDFLVSSVQKNSGISKIPNNPESFNHNRIENLSQPVNQTCRIRPSGNRLQRNSHRYRNSHLRHKWIKE